ncbi:MAG: hypothetical protein V1858_05130 [Candidatus Gottesmanbacteria bacterium]
MNEVNPIGDSAGSNLQSESPDVKIKSSLSYWKIGFFAVFFLWLLSTAWFLIYSNRKNYTNEQKIQSLKPSPTSVSVIPTQNTSNVPKENSLYLGTYEDKEVIFYTNSHANQGGSGTGGVKVESGPYTGAMAAVGTKSLGYSNPYDFRKLQNPRMIATDFPNLIGLAVSAMRNGNDAIYVSLMLDLGVPEPNYVNKIYKIDLQNVTNKEVWSNKLTKESNKYTVDGFAGAADILQVEDKYLVLSLGLCFNCSPYSLKEGILIINTDTGKEKFLGMVGDVKISSGGFSYRKLSGFKEPCPTDTAYCLDADETGKFRTVYKPSGELITETLP